MFNSKENITTSSTINSSETGVKEDEVIIKVYKKRWFILVLYAMFALSNYIHLVQYSVVANKIQEYYNISYLLIDWTSTISPLFHVIFSLPGNYVLDKLGLRKTVIISTVGTTLGACIKLGSVNRDRFWLAFLGHAIVCIFQACIIPTIPKLSATWFGYKQIAMASACAFMGLQVGVSLSFILPPILLSKEREVESGLYMVNIIYAGFSVVVMALIILFFSNKPKVSPSLAEQNLINEKENKNSDNYFQVCKKLFFYRSYMFFVIIFAINISSLNAFQILLNQVILLYYPGADVHVGILGILNSSISILGSVTVGAFLDKYKKFRQTVYVVIALYFLSMVMFITTMSLSLYLVYVSFLLLGVGFGAILSAGVELIVELTYPQAQNITVGFSNMFVQMSTVIITSLYGFILRSIGSEWANIFIIVTVLISNSLFIFTKIDLRRQDAQTKMANKAVSS